MHFACTQCGKCCNRAPEVELSESLALADAFVFRLMFRLYWLPQQLSDFRTARDDSANSSSLFYGRKRLLSAFAARKYPVKLWRDGKRVACTKYLMISALALDTSPGACSQLNGNGCSIYERRPLSCRTVPLHYSRAEALAEADLRAFVGTPGYRCDTSNSAAVLLNEGRIVDPAIKAARLEALALAERDRAWSGAIVRRLGKSSSLPSLTQIEANAQFGASTTSMLPAWRIAADLGLVPDRDFLRLINDQLGLIDRELERGRSSQDTQETLAEMRNEYGEFA